MTNDVQTPVRAELRARQGRVREIEGEIAALELEQRKAKRRVSRETGRLRDYFDQVARGEIEPDAERERELRQAIRAAEDSVLTRQERYQGRPGELVAFDPRIDAELDVARQRLQDAEYEVSEFKRERFAELVNEGIDDAQRVADQLVITATAFLDAWRNYEECAAGFTAIGVNADEIPDPFGDAGPTVNQVLVNLLRAGHSNRATPAPKWALLTGDGE